MIITYNCALNCYTNLGLMEDAEKLFIEIDDIF